MRKVVFLVDMNAFFISCEMTRQTQLRGKPAAVAGDPQRRTGIILAANYEARAYGVKTTMLVHEAQRLCPGIALVPPDHDFYEQKSREVMQLLRQFTPVVEPNSIDEAWLDMTGCEKLSGTPLEAAQTIMQTINEKLDLWCSIGISDNKFLAKMASEMKKPLGITELWPENVPGKLWPLPVGAMYGVGQKTAEKLKRLGVATIGDLARLSQEFLVERFGKSGIDLHRHAHGLEDAPVLATDDDTVQSIGRSTTLSGNVSDLEKAKRILLGLSDEVAATARKQDLKGQVVQITLKYTDFKVITRQSMVPATNLSQEVFLAGCTLLARNWDPAKPVRLIGISLGHFQKQQEDRQLNLFDQIDRDALEAAPAKSPGAGKVDQAVDSIRERFGQNSVTRASLLKKK
ncbi:MAG: DNA polymerase IV [Clostridia bacterium]|nr:DNA polymerase IV [Clostridia bacterium]